MTDYKKTVLITGASRGIGRACAVELARTGHALVLNSRRPSAEMDETVRLCEEAGAEVRTLFFDVGSTEAARTAIEADIAANGAYWGVVLNAGVTCDNAFPALEEEDWKRVIDVDLNGFYNVIHPVVMPMVRARKGGRIVTMSSVSGVTGNRGQTNYSAAKAGLIGACRRARQAPHHGQLRRARPHRHGHGRHERNRPRARDGDDSDAAHRHPGGGGGRRRLPHGRACVLHHAPSHQRQRRHDLMRRVVVTGMGGVTSLGQNWETVKAGLLAHRNAVRRMHEWDDIEGLNARLGAPVLDFTLPEHYTRKRIRSMGRVSLLSTRATELALEQAGLIDDPVIKSGRTGIAYGSCTGSTRAVADFGEMIVNRNTRGITATTYVQMMPHTTAVNTGLFFGITGRVIPTPSACTSGSQAIGYAWEAIRHGYQDVMVAGGAEELCPSEVAVFDTLFAASTRNDEPELTPRPFDANRDGLVIGEGACTLVLEEFEHARARGARIYAELVGFATNCDATHITQPNSKTMRICMEEALRTAGLAPSDIGYLSAHGTATSRGDCAESNATASLFGNRTPVSSLKSFFGHTLGACGSIEAWFAIEMMREGWFSPTINLTDIDPECGELDYITGKERRIDTEFVQSNNFAFGGINTSLIFKRM